MSARNYQQRERQGRTAGLSQGRRGMDHDPKVGPLTELETQANQSAGVRRTAQLREVLNSPVQREAAGASENRTGLSDGLKSGLEQLSGMDLSGVRVHYNSPKPAQLQALAYTQGQDIHVAPGQEQHLPHESWHVVQQMQGRVRPTMQFEGTAINDDAGLEREADVKGRRAMSVGREASSTAGENTSARPIPTAAHTVQRFSIERELTSGEVYSVSDDKALVTGMATPNHELFVDNATKIGRMNNAVSASPLELSSTGTSKLFGKEYLQVRLSFKSDKKDTADLKTTYERAVVPGILSFRKGLLSEKGEEIDKAVSSSGKEINPQEINVPLAKAVKKLELLKKLILVTLARPDYRDEDAGEVEDAYKVVQTLEAMLYSSKMNQTKMNEAFAKANEEDYERFPQSPILHEVTTELEAAMQDLYAALPQDREVNLMSFHSFNFQANQIEAVQGPDNVLLYRACDVTASTLLGNKISSENADRLKTYVAGGGTGAFHYATKIIQSGGDWVTLEGFAASDRERQIIGIGEESSAKNLDNTWQYIMYGRIGGALGPLSDEDRYFELYTKLRYYLKGIKVPGSFSPQQRGKLVAKQLSGESFLPLFETGSGVVGFFKGLVTNPEKAATALFGQLVVAGILDDTGRVANPENLDLEQVTKALPKEKSVAPGVFKILRNSIPSRHIQIGLSSDLANLSAWYAYLGAKPEELVALQDRMSYGIMEEREDPRAVSRTLWSDLAPLSSSAAVYSVNNNNNNALSSLSYPVRSTSPSFLSPLPSLYSSGSSALANEEKGSEGSASSSVAVQDPSAFLDSSELSRVWAEDAVGQDFLGVDGNTYKLQSYDSGTFYFRKVS